jgi:SAM-dependent methyltransferase
MARAATLSRSITLFRAFLREQSDPDHFYGVLAADSVRQLGEYVALDGTTVLDVGGGPGYFADAFRGAGAVYVGLEPDAGEMAARGEPQPGTVRASGEALPVRTAAVDVCYSSNVLEHVPHPWTMTAEMVRVTRPGGTVFLSFTPWWSPWGGHETSPWHYLGGGRARRRHLRRTGQEPKTKYGESLFPVSVGGALRWARWVIAIPGLREIVSWNLVVVMRRR